MVYLDFTKTFDRVDHTFFLTKLINMRIRGKVFCWRHDFLIGRKTCYHVNWKLSSERNVDRRLFAVLISNCWKWCLPKFASDTSFAYVTRTLAERSRDYNCVYLQNWPIKIYKWATDRNKKLKLQNLKLWVSLGKAEIRTKKPLHGFPFPCFYIKDEALNHSFTSVRDLGVRMECGASFDKLVSLS